MASSRGRLRMSPIVRSIGHLGIPMMVPDTCCFSESPPDLPNLSMQWLRRVSTRVAATLVQATALAPWDLDCHVLTVSVRWRLHTLAEWRNWQTHGT